MIKRIIRRILPRRVYRRLKATVYRRFCPLCDQGCRYFTPFGDPVREEARCPHCQSLERHRLVWLFFDRMTNLFDGHPRRMLHMAPEQWLGWLLMSTKSIDYVSGDLTPGRAMVEMDLTQIPFPAESFDVVYASHVLEHVPDDRQAMREIVRILKPGGWAVLQVPIVGETTDEDLTVTDPEERRLRFGQFDHVRAYGRDYRDRLAAAGFHVDVIPYAQSFSPHMIFKFGLDAKECIYFCRKRGADTPRTA